MSPETLHVEPTSTGAWMVHRERDPAPLSEHAEATQAIRAAMRRGTEAGRPVVLVHDRYFRVHAAVLRRKAD